MIIRSKVAHLIQSFHCHHPSRGFPICSAPLKPLTKEKSPESLHQDALFVMFVMFRFLVAHPIKIVQCQLNVFQIRQ